MSGHHPDLRIVAPQVRQGLGGRNANSVIAAKTVTVAEDKNFRHSAAPYFVDYAAIRRTKLDMQSKPPIGMSGTAQARIERADHRFHPVQHAFLNRRPTHKVARNLQD